jgi:hypothetical protein
VNVAGASVRAGAYGANVLSGGRFAPQGDSPF